MSTTHSRNSSNSFRIAIDHSEKAKTPPRRYSVASTSSGPRSPLLGLKQSRSSSTLASLFPSSSRTSNPLRKALLALAAAYVVFLLLRTAFFSTPLDPLPDTPTVDREAIEKLRLLEIHYGIDHDPDDDPPPGSGQENGGSRGLDESHPPLVEKMPEPIRPNPLIPIPLERLPATELDPLVCPSSHKGPCSFLLPAWLGEQETKAQLHLYQLGLLALALNRTLVLPNVAKSRLSTCYTNPFDFYYAFDALDELGIPTISQAEFLEWAERRDPPPTAQIVSMTGVKIPYPQGAIEIDSAADPTLVPNKPTRNLCLRAPKSRLDFSGHSPLAIYPPEGYHKSEAGRTRFGESVVNTLNSVDVGSKSSRASSNIRAPYELPNVLAFNYELRFPIMSPSVVTSFMPALHDAPPLPFSHFPYADTWTNLANQVADSLSPFIAVHWRTETLPINNLIPCATALVSRLVALKRDYPAIKNVYLATDYPIESLLPSSHSPFSPSNAANTAPHSGTFAKAVTEQHHSAFKLLLKDFSKRALKQHGLHLTTFALQEGALRFPDELVLALANTTTRSLAELDPGLVGIVDKAVAMRAEVFLTGFTGENTPTKGKDTRHTCAKISSFTGQIVKSREEGLETVQGEVKEGRGGEGERGTLWSAVRHWSIGGKEDD